MIAMV